RPAGRRSRLQGRAARTGLGLRLRRRSEHRRGLHQRAAPQDRRPVRPGEPGHRAGSGIPAGRSLLMHWSVRLRATVVATVTVALALGTVGLVLVLMLKGSLESGASQEAARRADEAAVTLAQGSEGADPGRPALTVTAFTPADPDVRVVGTAAVDAGAPAMSTSFGTGAGAAGQAWGSGYATAQRLVTTSAGPVTVSARVSLGPARAALTMLRELLLAGLPVLLLLVAGLTGLALAPVSGIRATFADITATDLHRRVPVPRSGDEIARLARTMNATLD